MICYDGQELVSSLIPHFDLEDGQGIVSSFLAPPPLPCFLMFAAWKNSRKWVGPGNSLQVLIIMVGVRNCVLTKYIVLNYHTLGVYH